MRNTNANNWEKKKKDLEKWIALMEIFLVALALEGEESLKKKRDKNACSVWV